QRAQLSPQHLTPKDVMVLQRSVGNQVVQRLVSGSRSQSSDPAHHTHVQRATAPITRTPHGSSTLQRVVDGDKAPAKKRVAKMVTNSLLDPGVPAKVKAGSPVYTSGSDLEDGSAAELTRAGLLTRVERGLSHQTGDPKWVKFTFQTKTVERR